MGRSLLVERVERKILLMRGQTVMLDRDLATLYGVGTKALVRSVRRNIERFPSDFMFRLTRREFTILRCQIGTSSSDAWGGRRYLPYVFTEQHARVRAPEAGPGDAQGPGEQAEGS